MQILHTAYIGLLCVGSLVLDGQSPRPSTAACRTGLDSVSARPPQQRAAIAAHAAHPAWVSEAILETRDYCSPSAPRVLLHSFKRTPTSRHTRRLLAGGCTRGDYAEPANRLVVASASPWSTVPPST